MANILLEDLKRVNTEISMQSLNEGLRDYLKEHYSTESLMSWNGLTGKKLVYDDVELEIQHSNTSETTYVVLNIKRYNYDRRNKKALEYLDIVESKLKHDFAESYEILCKEIIANELECDKDDVRIYTRYAHRFGITANIPLKHVLKLM